MKFAMRIGSGGVEPGHRYPALQDQRAGSTAGARKRSPRTNGATRSVLVARLAFDLMIWTGQRGGDARKMGPASVRDTGSEPTQEKTKVFVSLPIMPGLAESILATPTVGAFFVVTEFGKQFSVKSFGNKFRQWCDEVRPAELLGCTGCQQGRGTPFRRGRLLESGDQGVDWSRRPTTRSPGTPPPARSAHAVRRSRGQRFWLTLRKG
ncbi:hypothetical protein QP185_04440 [Sphingomonas aerolata]|uniref:hypothetical protein n=1 Tax=Sphingomonas aerolata TaxID=185951 RepID=UPI002FE23ABC